MLQEDEDEPTIAEVIKSISQGSNGAILLNIYKKYVLKEEIDEDKKENNQSNTNDISNKNNNTNLNQTEKNDFINDKNSSTIPTGNNTQSHFTNTQKVFIGLTSVSVFVVVIWCFLSQTQKNKFWRMLEKINFTSVKNPQIHQ